ncbi:MAG: chlorosome envelope protein B [Chlorobium sp.]|jgi:chlorosome envelope protein B|nr:chlorosome envelope protein B [Chlorobium sp.]
MSNDAIHDFSAALNNLLTTAGTMAQQQVDLLNIGIKTAGQLIEPLVKTSSELIGNLFSNCCQIVQNIASSIFPQK